MNQRRKLLTGLGALGLSAMAKPLWASGEDVIRLNIPGPHLMPFFPLELIPVLELDRVAGVRLSVRYHPSGVLAAEDMLAGNADFAGTGFPILPTFVARKLDVAAFATLSSGAPPYAILVRKELAKEIRHIGHLRGRSLGVPIGGASTKTYLQLMAEYWVKQHGIDPAEVRWLPVAQNYDGALGALASGIADAVFCEEPTSSTLVREGLGVQIASLYDPRGKVKIPGKNHIRAVLVASRQTLATRPDAAERMVKMLRGALAWMYSTPPEQIPLRLGIKDPARRADMVSVFKRLPNFYSRDGGFRNAEMEATRQFMKAVGLGSNDGRDISTLVDSRWVRR